MRHRAGGHSRARGGVDVDAHGAQLTERLNSAYQPLSPHLVTWHMPIPNPVRCCTLHCTRSTPGDPVGSQLSSVARTAVHGAAIGSAVTEPEVLGPQLFLGTSARGHVRAVH